MSGVKRKMKNKLLTVTLIVLVTITLVAVVVLALIWQMNKDDKDSNGEASIDEIVESTVEIPEITTNLAGRQFVRISLNIQTDSEAAAEELEKRIFQVNNIVIHELSEVTREELEGKAGKQALESTIQSLINPLMQEGEIERVYIVSYIIQ